MAEVIWCSNGLVAPKLLKEAAARIRRLHCVAPPGASAFPLERARYGGCFANPFYECREEGVFPFTVSSRNAILAMVLETTAAFDKVLNVHAKGIGVSVVAAVLSERPNVEFLARLKENGWTVDTRELYWERMGTPCECTSSLVLMSSNEAVGNLQEVITQNLNKFKQDSRKMYKPRAQSPRSTLERLRPKPESEDESKSNKRAREAVECLLESSSRDQPWYINARAKRARCSIVPPRCTSTCENIVCMAGKCYRLGTHEHLSILGYTSDDDVNLFLTANAQDIVANTAPKNVAAVLLGAALDVWDRFHK